MGVWMCGCVGVRASTLYAHHSTRSRGFWEKLDDEEDGRTGADAYQEGRRGHCPERQGPGKGGRGDHGLSVYRKGDAGGSQPGDAAPEAAPRDAVRIASDRAGGEAGATVCKQGDAAVSSL